MTSPDLASWLRDAINTITNRLRAVEENPRSEVTGGFQTILFADLPAAATSTGQVYYVSNGRKEGEGAGAGTGVNAYCDGTDWYRFSTDTAVEA